MDGGSQPGRGGAAGPGLAALFEARSVCLVGASANERRLTGRPLAILERHGFPGAIYLVNPNRQRIGSRRCYPRVRDLPEPVDVALVMVPAPDVPSVVEECGRKGISYAVILSSGFEEVAGARSLTARLEAAAAGTGIRIVGPNSEGIWSVPSQLMLTFGSAAQRDVIKEGPVSVLSQSGSIGGGILRNLLERGVGCRYFVSVGNETDLTTIDYLEYLVARGDSTTILMFVEGLRDGERLREVAAAARAQGTRLVALKAGSSEAGRQATASHTGKIASSQKIYSSIFKQCGVLEVAGIGDLVEVAEVLSAALPVPSLPGPAGLAVVGISGGSRALIADACETAGVPLATFAPSTEAALVEVIPAYGQARNPTDVTGQVLSRPEVFEHAVKTIAGDPATGAVLVQYANRGPTQVQENADLLARTTLESRKPVVASFLADDIDASTRRRLADAHIVCASAPDVAVKYVSWLYAARATQEAAVADADARVSVGPASSAPDLGSWRDQTAFLQRCGIAVPRWQVVDRAHPEGGADLDLVPPLVVKALPEDSDHKTEQGLVRLGLADADAARAAMAQMQQRTGCHRFLVQEMVTGGVEALLTVRDDPDFGPVLAIGSGGTLVEWLDDVAYVSVPCTRAEVLSALRRTGLHELLGGFRGAAPKDVDALVDAALALSEAYLRMADRPADLELNPLFVLDRGDGVTAVDVLVARPR